MRLRGMLAGMLGLVGCAVSTEEGATELAARSTASAVVQTSIYGPDAVQAYVRAHGCWPGPDQGFSTYDVWINHDITLSAGAEATIEVPFCSSGEYQNLGVWITGIASFKSASAAAQATAFGDGPMGEWPYEQLDPFYRSNLQLDMTTAEYNGMNLITGFTGLLGRYALHFSSDRNARLSHGMRVAIRQH